MIHIEILTKRQEEILSYLKSYIVSHGYPPTVREIGKALGISSPATIHAHLSNLEQKGYIRKDGSKNRALELLVENEFAIKENAFFRIWQASKKGGCNNSLCTISFNSLAYFFACSYPKSYLIIGIF